MIISPFRIARCDSRIKIQPFSHEQCGCLVPKIFDIDLVFRVAMLTLTSLHTSTRFIWLILMRKSALDWLQKSISVAADEPDMGKYASKCRLLYKVAAFICRQHPLCIRITGSPSAIFISTDKSEVCPMRLLLET
jgi:hypothetical protein